MALRARSEVVSMVGIAVVELLVVMVVLVAT